MIEKTDKVLISLGVGERQSLFILLAADGSINRLGSGAADNQEKDMFIGVTRDGLFEEFMRRVPGGLLEHQGAYDIAEKQGVTCKLSLLFGSGESTLAGFEFTYGSESQGPPQEICDLVLAARELTEPWYRTQQRMTAQNKAPGFFRRIWRRLRGSK